MKIPGTVSITLDDYHAILEKSAKIHDLEEKTKLAAKELQVFLTFICDKADISEYIEEFNKQSKTSEIIFSGGRAQIKFKDEKENNS
tara:strand:- start:2573 stop:2833 length:261 start_codon:yes stop_codon:yes gene_type:complete